MDCCSVPKMARDGSILCRLLDETARDGKSSFLLTREHERSMGTKPGNLTVPTARRYLRHIQDGTIWDGQQFMPFTQRRWEKEFTQSRISLTNERTFVPTQFLVTKTTTPWKTTLCSPCRGVCSGSYCD